MQLARKRVNCISKLEDNKKQRHEGNKSIYKTEKSTT